MCFRERSLCYFSWFISHQFWLRASSVTSQFSPCGNFQLKAVSWEELQESPLQQSLISLQPNRHRVESALQAVISAWSSGKTRDIFECTTKDTKHPPPHLRFLRGKKWRLAESLASVAGEVFDVALGFFGVEFDRTGWVGLARTEGAFGRGDFEKIVAVFEGKLSAGHDGVFAIPPLE